MCAILVSAMKIRFVNYAVSKQTLTTASSKLICFIFCILLVCVGFEQIFIVYSKFSNYCNEKL